MTYMLTYKQAIEEYKLHADSYDHWGSVMSVWFDITNILYWIRETPIPNDWDYRAGAGQDDTQNQWLHDCSDDVLIRLGNTLERAARILEHKGESY
jgi:hypothetical protein